jgi:FtsP/CotA-like multicopper oxidase with cupredoxin domain
VNRTLASRNAFLLRRLTLPFFVCALFSSISAHAQDPADQVCVRFPEASQVANPPDLYSNKGVLEVNLLFKTTKDAAGLTRYCFVTDRGVEAPTLHVLPGDKLVLHLKNELPEAPVASGIHAHTLPAEGDCPGGAMTASSTNIHFHGTTLPPTCHQDDVLNTLVQPDQSFDYVLNIPSNESPGLYWYHPHPHGFTEPQVQGGASGALIVEGIESVYPELNKLPQRTLVLRDQKLNAGQAAVKDDANKPSWDLSLNYVPIHYPGYTPAVITTRPRQREFWRVLNAAADALLDLQVLVKGVPQPLQVFAVDGVPLPKGSAPLTQDTVPLAPGARVEFVVTTPDVGDEAQLVTLKHETGPTGDSDPARPIAKIVSSANAEMPREHTLHAANRPKETSSFDGLAAATPVAHRRLVFAEEADKKNDANTIFFIATDPGVHAPFHFSDLPKFKVRQGTVEEWRIENVAKEDHTFHIHQLHFQVVKINDLSVVDPAIRDTVTLPYWTGKGPHPSVTLLMDFRDPNTIGVFPFHCHILAHEDSGMMAKLEVLPPAIVPQLTLTISPRPAVAGAPVTFTAQLKGLKPSDKPTGFMSFQIDAGGHPIFAIENGVATYTTTFREGGKHTVIAKYSGDDVYGPVASISIDLEVQPKH